MNSKSAELDRLQMIKPNSPVLVHSQDARRAGISHGDVIEIESPGGTVIGVALVGEGADWDPARISKEGDFSTTSIARKPGMIRQCLLEADIEQAGKLLGRHPVQSRSTRAAALTIYLHSVVSGTTLDNSYQGWYFGLTQQGRPT